ncbi:CRISPR-associated helicase/endonuclease Cas3 [Nocardia paucivorans]|uniref:CRISPR-associated helicase/endonuclease Cas3 n=1 Tax=Nocardia paucivorans TaxID=114259 RepID=UPI0002D8EA4A|nr:CRISPR-associated helicase/endonuclease Cas3 [Nocardia paucivorans]
MNELATLRAKSPRTGFPHGEPLTDHLSATLAGARRLERRVGRIAAVPEGFWRWVMAAALTHDAGKVPAGFQAMVAGGAGPVWGQRHEVYSLGFVADLLASWPEPDRGWVGLGVVTHHRPLTGVAGRSILSLYNDGDAAAFAARFGPVSAVAQRQLRQWLASVLREEKLAEPAPDTDTDLAEAGFRLLEQLRAQWEYPDDVDADHNLTAVLIQGAVTFSDHVSSAHGQLLTDQPIDAGFAERLTVAMAASGKPLRRHQHEAAALAGHLMLRTPTGSGKTEAALLWAARQVTELRHQCGGQPRVFYLLPYLASINAMVDRVGRILGDEDAVGVVHSKAAAYHLHRSLCGDEDDSDAARRAVSRAAATRLFRELVRVGTPYQLLRGAVAGTACSSILIDAANSVFVLDELHSYEPQRLGMILASTAFWVRLGGRIAVVTATIPRRLVELLNQCVDGEVFQEIRPEGTQWSQRHRLKIGTDHLTGGGALAEIGNRLRAGQSVLVVANNVADALFMAERLGTLCRELYGEDPMLLHSRFKTMDRADIESRIRDRFGTDRPHRPGLLVATQVVEVSLDVSFDALHTSGAPLEPLIQRFGRINRIAARPPADVVVHPPRFGPRPGSVAEWADGVYEKEPTALTMAILQAHDGSVLDEQILGAWLDELYDSPWGETWAMKVTYFKDWFARYLQFEGVFGGNRDKLGEEFEELFDGVEAILAEDVDAYSEALNSVSNPQAGRLLGSQYLIPLPHYARRFARYDRGLDVLIIDGVYDPDHGLTRIEHERRDTYQLGELI